jgi:hypothetical protein
LFVTARSRLNRRYSNKAPRRDARYASFSQFAN